MRKIKYFILFLSIFSGKEDFLYAFNFQDSVYYAIEAKYHYGFVIPH